MKLRAADYVQNLPSIKEILSVMILQQPMKPETPYIHQGYGENGMRTFRSSNCTNRCGQDDDALFRDENSRRCREQRLRLEYGFLSEYNGCHTHE